MTPARRSLTRSDAVLLIAILAVVASVALAALSPSGGGVDDRARAIEAQLRCPTCQGVWLDPGELERLNNDVAEEVWKALAYGRPLG